MARKFLGGKPTVGSTDVPVVLTSDKLSALSATTSAELAGVISDETGSGSLVFATSPTLTTPNIGVATATSVNGTTIPSSKTLVVTTDKLSALAATTSAELAGVISDETGSGALVFGTSPSLTTPSLGVATATSINSTTIPTSKTLVVTTDKLSVHAATSSSELAGVISDETGSGALVFATTPTLTTPVITQATSTPSFSSNTYTVTTGDEGKMLLASNSTTAGNVKIPTNATTAFAVGTQIHIIQTGTGQLTISATTSGTTSVLSAGGTAASPKLRAQYSAATMLKTATDTWYVFGDIA